MSNTNVVKRPLFPYLKLKTSEPLKWLALEKETDILLL